MIHVVIALCAVIPAKHLETIFTADAAVYGSILEHTIRPQAIKELTVVEPDFLPNVVVSDSTIAVCESNPNSRVGCIGEWPLTRLKELLGGNDDLVNRFRALNAARHSIAGLEIEGAIFASAELPRETRVHQSERTNGSAIFSKPLYTSSGHAIVYASYYCGNLCGYGWLFLLAIYPDGWRVVSVEGVWIS
jgi:hypothetical protein